MAEFPPASEDGRLAGLRPGILVGGYRLEERIGSGAMAIVFRARDEALGRSVALKVLAGQLAMDAEFRERFIRESQAASQVDHPNIIPVYAAGEDAGVLYLAMRHVSGGDLHSVVDREGPLPARRMMSLLAPIASALDAAHAAGIVHRDVKPANVLVDVSRGRPDHPYLSDFGLAKREMIASGLTNVGEFVGTPGFASPEQISGRRAGPPTDQYALACVAFTMLTAQLPFRHRHPDAVLWAQMSQPPPRATPWRPDLAEAVDEVLARALTKDPLERFPSCGEFASALEQALTESPRAAGAPVASPPEQAAEHEPVRGQETVHGHDALGQDPAGTWGAAPTPAPTPAPTLAPALAPAPRKAGRARRSAIAGAVGSVVVIAAASAILLNRPAPTRAAGTPASTPKVSAELIGALRDPGHANVISAAFPSTGGLQVLDQTGKSYTYGLVPPPRDFALMKGAGIPGAGAWANASPAVGLLTMDGEVIVVPRGCAAAGACAYELFGYNGPRAVPVITAGPDSPVATGNFTVAATTRTGDGVQVWNARTLAQVAELDDPGHRPLGAVALSPDGQTVAAVTTGAARQAYVWNTASRAAPAIVPLPGNVGANWAMTGNAGTPLALAGQTLAASDGVTTSIHHLGTHRPATSVTGGLLAISPDGALVATTDPDVSDKIDLISTATGQEVYGLTGPKDGLTAVTFGIEGHSIIAGDSNGDIFVWGLTGSV